VSLRLGEPLVHGAWQASWWEGDSAWAELLGAPCQLPALEAVASQLCPGDAWHSAIHPACRNAPPPPDALIVLAGQQPMLGGGAALVAHKAATAISLASTLSLHWQRAVVPVFLLATQDHDTSEIDHLDLINMSNNSLLRIRCPVTPQSEMFCRAQWDGQAFELFKQCLINNSAVDSVDIEDISPGGSVADHVAHLLDRAFGATGLLLLEAHRLPQAPTTTVLTRALEDQPGLADVLRTGARALDAVDREPAFDPDDPRPLALESRNGRRRRLEAGDTQAVQRVADQPGDFSPHAALRPIAQAAGLPVVAQVCGPSELLYLGQARGLHSLFGVQAPVLVPRLEATHLMTSMAGLPPTAGGGNPEGHGAGLLGKLDLGQGRAPARRAEGALVAAAREFARVLRTDDPSLAPRLRRFEDRLARSARRLAEAPSWRGRGQLGPSQAIHPRGRYQDTTLAWLPQAWSAGDPAGWAQAIVDLCRPLSPPEHVTHAYPEDTSRG